MEVNFCTAKTIVNFVQFLNTYVCNKHL